MQTTFWISNYSQMGQAGLGKCRQAGGGTKHWNLGYCQISYTSLSKSKQVVSDGKSQAQLIAKWARQVWATWRRREISLFKQYPGLQATGNWAKQVARLSKRAAMGNAGIETLPWISNY